MRIRPLLISTLAVVGCKSNSNEGAAPKADGPSAAAGRRRHGGACAACDADGPRAGQAARGYSPSGTRRQIILGPGPLTMPGHGRKDGYM